MVRVVAAVAGLLVLGIGAAWLLQRQLIYFPDDAPVGPAQDAVAGALDVTLTTDDGLELGAWLVPPSGSDLEVAVLVANGNAGSRAARAPLAEALRRNGLTVLLFDYRGYGGNPGSPSERGLVSDARAARDHLVRVAGFPMDRIVFYGESLGAAVVTALATESAPAGLLLRSPFESLTAVGRAHYPWLPVGLLLRDEFPLVDQLPSVQAPVTVVYGTADGVVPAEQSRAVADAAPRLVEVVVVTGADHNDRSLLDGRQLVEATVRLAGPT